MFRNCGSIVLPTRHLLWLRTWSLLWMAKTLYIGTAPKICFTLARTGSELLLRWRSTTVLRLSGALGLSATAVLHWLIGVIIP